MEIMVTKNGKRFGPYSETQVVEYVAKGHFTASDLVWHKGIPNWTPLGVVVKLPGAVPPVLPLQERIAYSGGFSPADIVAIARNQKAIIWLILFRFATVAFQVSVLRLPQLGIAGKVISPSLMGIPIAALVGGLLSCVFVYRLARAVHMSPTWIFAILPFIPLVGMITLLSVNSKANEILKRKGIRIGMMGANRYDVQKLTSVLLPPSPLNN